MHVDSTPAKFDLAGFALGLGLTLIIKPITQEIGRRNFIGGQWAGRGLRILAYRTGHGPDQVSQRYAPRVVAFRERRGCGLWNRRGGGTSRLAGLRPFADGPPTRKIRKPHGITWGGPGLISNIRELRNGWSASIKTQHRGQI